MTFLRFLVPGRPKIMVDSDLEDVIVNFEEIRLPNDTVDVFLVSRKSSS